MTAKDGLMIGISILIYAALLIPPIMTYLF